MSVSTRNKKNVTPRYDQITLNLADRHNKLQQIISPNPEDAGVWIFTDTGCRCRKKFVSITTIRLRRSSGIGCRKTLFQICELRMVSPMDMCGSQVAG